MVMESADTPMTPIEREGAGGTMSPPPVRALKGEG
jgi:hypothetical protein